MAECKRTAKALFKVGWGVENVRVMLCLLQGLKVLADRMVMCRVVVRLPLLREGRL